MKLKLQIEPIPSINWGISLAKILPKEVWDSVRREVYEVGNYTCIVCGASNKQLHCHEKWKYDDSRKTQKLVGFECCCRDCHAVHHWGRTLKVNESKPEEIKRLIRHFCEVNNCTERAFEEHRIEVAEVVKRRSKLDYVVKFGMLSPRQITAKWEELKG